MNTVASQMTVYFENPFWVGVWECSGGGNYEVSRVVFGAEPKEFQVYEIVCSQYCRLRFGKSEDVQQTFVKRISPKRMQRAVHRQTQRQGIGTKAQQALKLQQEAGKLERRCHSKEQRDAEKERQFLLHEQKLRAKHRGH
ncbi:MAG: YjdF family protein [Oscillospiraceae bacterium]|nr:YjdF family protein [Oscillospiraceae bacterium]